MKDIPKDYFAKKAKDYDKEKASTKNVSDIADLILKEIKYLKDMRIMDFGSGTGLLLSKVAPYVNEITAIDISKSMNEVLKNKKDGIDCKLEIIEIDLTKEDLNKKFDGIISSMTIHHINDTLSLFQKFFNMLHSNGTIALSDLDEEDGTFHDTDTGVFHYGFNRKEFISLAKSVGFIDLKIQTVGVVEKPNGKYPVFLLTGKKL